MAHVISDPHSLHRLIYFSRQSFTPSMNPADEVETIVSASVELNRAAGVTGLLLEHDGWFVQALEGPAQKVMVTYRRILNDHRHKDGQIIHAGPVAARSFGDWAMCARRLSATDDAILETLSQRDLFDPARLTPAAALRLLETVRGIKARARLTASIEI